MNIEKKKVSTKFYSSPESEELSEDVDDDHHLTEMVQWNICYAILGENLYANIDEDLAKNSEASSYFSNVLNLNVELRDDENDSEYEKKSEST